MSKVKDKPDINYDFPEPEEYQDELNDLTADIIRETITDLTVIQDTRPTTEEAMIMMAERLAALELEKQYSDIEKFLYPRKRARTKLEKAQAAADKWCATSRRKRSKREVAKYLAKQGYGSFDYLNKNLKIPS